MECLECGRPIIGRRSDSKYCSKTCAGRAKNRRADERKIEKATQHMQVLPHNTPNSLYGFTEIRELEKDKFDTVLNLKEGYESQIKQLETSNLNKDFEIRRLKDKIEDLHNTHQRDLQNASTNTVKETVNAITAMPAIQGALGALANNLIPSKDSALGGMEETLSITEKQIIQEVRKMETDAQQYLVQMLYFLFSKSHAEQMQIFGSLTAYMQAENNTDEEEDLP